MFDPFQPKTVTFHQPIDMLLACHTRVRLFADRLDYLARYLAEHPVDAAAIATAKAVLRYFNEGAAQHHLDEEVDLFPVLYGLADASLRRSLDFLSAEHLVLHEVWQDIEHVLLRIVDAGPAEVGGAVVGRTVRLDLDKVSEFVQRYRRHAQVEEDEIFPKARHLPMETLKNLGRRMAARRGVNLDEFEVPE